MRLFTLAALAALMIATPATAQRADGVVCGIRANMISQLEGKYRETRYTIGLVPRVGVFEWWANAETGSWTITRTTARGVMCMLASGVGFEAIEPVEIIPGEDG